MTRGRLAVVIGAVVALFVAPWPAIGAPGDPGQDCTRLLVNEVEVYRSGACSTSPAATTTIAAATTTTVPVTTATAPPSGTFTDDFSSGLDGWSFAHWRNEMPGNNLAASTASIVNGEARIVAADENYGDATLRSSARYNLTGGEFRITVRDNTDGYPLLGSAFIAFTTLPYNAPSITRDNGNGPTPHTGAYLQLRDNCRIPWGPPQASRYVNHIETITLGTCLGPTPSGPIEVRYTNGVADFYAGGVRYATLALAVPATGFVLLGVHNHASSKYADGPGPMPAVVGTFDNVTYPAAATTGQTWVTFNAYSANTPVNPRVIVGGVTYPIVPHATPSHSYAEAVPVGNVGAVQVLGFDTVANVELVAG